MVRPAASQWHAGRVDVMCVLHAACYKRYDDTNYDACAVCHHTTQAKRNYDTNYDACSVCQCGMVAHGACVIICIIIPLGLRGMVAHGTCVIICIIVLVVMVLHVACPFAC